MAFNVIKTSRVRPATPLIQPLVLPLTFFDLMWLKRNPTEQVIFYNLTSSSSSRDSFYSEILPKLERSLSLSLTHFLPLSGHLKWDPQEPKPHIVVFPHDAVSLTVAESDADFSRVSGKGLRLETELCSLVPDLRISFDSASVFSLQITLFPNQGFSLGTKVHHAVMDGLTAAKFHKSWAHICKYGSIPQQMPNLIDRSIVNVPPGLEPKLLKLLSHLADGKDSARTLKPSPLKEIDDAVRITLELTQEMVRKLKEKVKKETTRTDLHLSTFVVTYAYVWTCMVKMRGGKADRPVRFRYVADCRNRLDPPVPDTYFGNCVISIVLPENKAKAFTGENGLVNGVKILSDSVKGIGQQGFESLWEKYEEDKKSFKMGTQVVSVTGSNQIGIYGADFGWGRPVNTEFLSIYQNGQISMSQGRDETVAVEIGISLTKRDMDVFLPLFYNGLDN